MTPPDWLRWNMNCEDRASGSWLSPLQGPQNATGNRSNICPAKIQPSSGVAVGRTSLPVNTSRNVLVRSDSGNVIREVFQHSPPSGNGVPLPWSAETSLGTAAMIAASPEDLAKATTSPGTLIWVVSGR